MAEYKSSYTGQEIDAGIAKANTALQEHQDISGKVDKITGKGLSTNDYTTAEKEKLASIDLSEKQDTLISGENIKTINGNSILGEGNLVIEGGSGGLTSVAHDNTLTGTGTNENPLGVDTTKIAQISDIPDTSDFITKSVDDLTNYTKTSDLGDLAVKNTVNYETEVTNKPTIPSEVTESTVSGWGFTKNTGTYSKPSSGIPENDLSAGVQTKLNSGGTTVIANPTLIGGEDTLESIQIGSTKYETKGIYPVDISIEEVPPQYETVDVTTTIFGDMTGTLTDESVYKATTSFNVTFWDTNLEPDRTGSKLKSVFIAVPSSFANKILSIVGSTSPVGEPTDTKTILQNKAIASMSNYSIICKVTLKAGLNEYTLDGNDTNVEIVTQSMIDSAPQCIGYFNPNGNDTGAFYFMATDTLGTELFGGYWNQGASAFHRTLGINWKYEKTIEVTPEHNELVMEMSNGDEISCSLQDVPITVEIASPLKGKKISFIGDSITDTTVVAKPYWGYIQDATHCTSIGYGIDGSTISNLTDHHPMYARIIGVDIDSDAVCVFGGTNDFGNHVTIGDQYTTDGSGVRTLNTNTSTFWGALNQMCINLQDRFATKSIYLCTPLRRGNFKTNTMNDKTPNNAGEYLDEYADAIRKACEWFSFNLIDLYATSGLYPYDADNASTYYMGTANAGDYLHPNAVGHQRIAKVMQLAMEKTFID